MSSRLLQKFSLLLLVLQCFGNLVQANNSPISQSTVEELALFYAEESIRKLRIPLHFQLLGLGKDNSTRQDRIDRIKSNPPKLNKENTVYPFGKNNSLSFTFDPQSQSMIVWQRMIKLKGKMSAWGLTAIEHATALNNASSEHQRGGGVFDYDPVRDALSLKLHYHRHPDSREQFYEELEQLLKAREKWSKHRFLKTSTKVVDQLTPPAESILTNEGFEAAILLRHFGVDFTDAPSWGQRFLDAWHRPDGYREPRRVSNQHLSSNNKMYVFILFKGATENNNGIAQVGATFRLIAPNGGVRLGEFRPLLWNAPAGSAEHTQIGINHVSFRMRDEPTGTYLVEMEVCDVASNRCVELSHPFEFR